MFNKMLPVVFKKTNCIARRMQEFPHAFDALVDGLNEINARHLIDIIKNSQESWEWDAFVEENSEYSRIIYEWIMNDKDYYVSILEELIDDDNMNIEEFENLVMFPELTISSKDSPGGEFLTPIDMLHAFIMHDVHNPENAILRYCTHHNYSSCDIIFYLRFINNIENHYPENVNGPYTREMYFKDTFENKDLMWAISKGALEVEFEMYDNAYLKEYFVGF